MCKPLIVPLQLGSIWNILLATQDVALLDDRAAEGLLPNADGLSGKEEYVTRIFNETDDDIAQLLLSVGVVRSYHCHCRINLCMTEHVPGAC